MTKTVARPLHLRSCSFAPHADSLGRSPAQIGQRLKDALRCCLHFAQLTRGIATRLRQHSVRSALEVSLVILDLCILPFSPDDITFYTSLEYQDDSREESSELAAQDAV